MAYIAKRKNGRNELRYCVRWRDGGGRDGKWQSTTLPTKRSAEAFKLAVEEAGERWPETSRTVDAPTVAEYAETFLEGLTGIRERTRHDYRRDLGKHVLPTFGGLKLDELSRPNVRSWVRVLEPKMSPKTLRGVHSLLSQMLTQAVEDGFVSSNVARGTKLPRVSPQSEDSCFLTPAEFGLIRSCAKADVRDFLSALAGTGMRWGEGAALEVRHVDLPRKRIRIEQAWERVPGNGMRIAEPKTRASVRTITLDDTTAALFARACDGKSPAALVFTSPQGEPLNHGHFRARRWEPALAKAAESGLTKRPRLHDLRHTHASWLIQAGVPLPVIKTRLGHTSITTTVDRYGHLANDSDYGVHAALSAALE